MTINYSKKSNDKKLFNTSRDYNFSPIIFRNLISNMGDFMNSAKDVLNLGIQKRLAWRDTFIRKENDLAELISLDCLGEKEKNLLSNALIKYSKNLLELVSKDLEKIHNNSGNIVLDIIYSFANSSELQVKKSYWLDILENQNKVLMEVVKNNKNNLQIQAEACDLLIGNCDILITGIKNEVLDQPILYVKKRLQNAKEQKNIANKEKLDINKLYNVDKLSSNLHNLHKRNKLNFEI